MNKQNSIDMEPWDSLMKSSILKNAPSNLEDKVMGQISQETSSVKIKRSSYNLPLIFAGGISLLTLILWLVSSSGPGSLSFNIPEQFKFIDSISSLILQLDLGLDSRFLSMALMTISFFLLLDFTLRAFSSKKRFS